ncbi:type II toxin-antitoxin system RelB/DinJ family antitoxin [Acidisphaera sp. S103]|uniref:type II toxin-antitoxin system RelB/DinJ family antitoxin n=1 Tax=Acidisphaera sp. S103 TaxID=1747223 RepID=UPI00131CFAFF|nr:type II toxin-antitoxin system RelB/DinJ family antitoxin [Acidisphaera sp. S103]
MSEALLSFRVDEQIERRAEAVFAAAGLTLADAVRAFLEDVANNRVPFDIPNAETQAALNGPHVGPFSSAEALFSALDESGR